LVRIVHFARSFGNCELAWQKDLKLLPAI
jgi:hypothetical protein